MQKRFKVEVQISQRRFVMFDVQRLHPVLGELDFPDAKDMRPLCRHFENQTEEMVFDSRPCLVRFQGIISAALFVRLAMEK